MSAAVSAMHQQPGAGPTSRLGNNSPVDSKRNIKDNESSRSSPQTFPSKLNPNNAPGPKVPAPLENPKIENTATDSKDSRDAPARDNDGPSDYFSMPRPSRLDQEPNPFEQSFASGGTSGASADPLATPKAILPPVTAMTSPAPLLGGSGGYNWGPHSLRSGPLSPAMLQGPTNTADLGFPHIRSGLTPNESGIRSGLTPGGSGSMFPVPSPSTSQIFNFGGATPGTMEFQRTAMSAAAKKSHPPPPLIPPPTTDIKMPDVGAGTLDATAIPPPHNDPQSKPRQPSDPFNESAHNAANGLYMLAQLGGQPGQYQQPPPHMPPTLQQNGSMESSPNLAKRVAVNNAQTANLNRGYTSQSAQSSVRGTSEMSPDRSESDDEQNGRKRNTRAKSASTGKRKNDDGSKAGNSSKKTRGSRSGQSGSEDEEGEGQDGQKKDTKKMTDEEKRKNFLERNRVAALKCRQRKKQWLANLQAKVEMYGTENDALNATVQSLREEIVSLKTLLLAHKDCPVARANGIQMDGPTMGDAYQHMPMMQTGYAPMMPQGVMQHPQPGERRFS